MKKLIVSIIIVSLLAAMPFVAVIAYALAQPNVYENTYLAALSDKYNRLNAINEPKIIIIGGSATAFGINSEIIERETGMPVVNFGLYGALGSKAMLELAKSNINKGDIVIFQPEYSTQLYSNFVGTLELLQALESGKGMLKSLSSRTRLELMATLGKYISDKNAIINMGNKPDPQNVYAYSSFNNYADISYPRPYNIMPDLYDTNSLIEISNNVISDDFLASFNDYYKYVKKRKANLYISMAPVNELAIINNTTEAKESFHDYLEQVFLAQVISSIDDSIMSYEYFYDTNYHLNDAGVLLRCYRLIGDIKRIIGDSTPISYTPPAVEQKIDINNKLEEENNEDAQYFNYEENIVGTVVRYAIKGVNQEGINKEKLTVPSSYNGKEVYKIESNAFANTKATIVYLPQTILSISNGAFAASKLNTVYIDLQSTANKLPMVGSGLLQNTNQELYIYVPKSRYVDFLVDYSWSIYSQIIRYY